MAAIMPGYPEMVASNARLSTSKMAVIMSRYPEMVASKKAASTEVSQSAAPKREAS